MAIQVDNFLCTGYSNFTFISREIKLNYIKSETKCLEILSFYTFMCTINEDDMIYGS